MLKQDEQSQVNSCWNKAQPDERVFIILGRDRAARTAIRAWAQARIYLGLNKPDDPQITEALECAELMQQERVK